MLALLKDISGIKETRVKDSQLIVQYQSPEGSTEGASLELTVDFREEPENDRYIIDGAEVSKILYLGYICKSLVHTLKV